MLRGTHPDLVEIGLDPEKKTPTISARQAREVVGQVRMQRYSARRRTFIIDPVDRMGVEAANALLKTLEEPPDGCLVHNESCTCSDDNGVLVADCP